MKIMPKKVAAYTLRQYANNINNVECLLFFCIVISFSKHCSTSRPLVNKGSSGCFHYKNTLAITMISYFEALGPTELDNITKTNLNSH